MTDVIEFSGDDSAYFDWLDRHPGGWVVNLRQGNSQDYAILHRASCGHIASRRAQPGAYTERSYRKLCAVSEAGILGGLTTLGSGIAISKRCNCSAKPNE